MPAPAEGFRRELGLVDATVIVAGGIIGVGIFANPSNVARILESPALILAAWMMGGAVALVGGFVWAELGSRFPDVGGQYVYLARAYPPVVAFLYGVALLFIINGGSLAAVSILFASYVDRTFVSLGAGGVRAAAAVTLVALTAVNALGIKAGKWTNNTLMAAKVAGMLALIGLAFSRGASPASDVASPLPAGGSWFGLLLTAMVPILFAYGGWQSCASLAGEIKDPSRNLARANVFGVLVVVTLYLSLNVAYLWVLTPAQMAQSPALAADMARAVAGDIGARLVAGLITISSLGFLAVVIMTGPRLYFAMARDGRFFAAAGRLHPRYQTPVVALWLQAAVSLTLLTTNTYDQLLSYVVFADWLFFGLTAASLFIARSRDGASSRTSHSAPRTPHPAPRPAHPAPGPAHPAPRPGYYSAPGHPWTTGAFVLVAFGVVINTFIVYPTQSLVGAGVLAIAAAVYALLVKPNRRSSIP
jgi:APA family basic amino acid/polyamine antiporter